MLRLTIFRLEEFLAVVNHCCGAVYLAEEGARKTNINQRYHLQRELKERYEDNHGWISLRLQVPNLQDYLKILYFSMGEC